jgi:hypothetical protein
MRIIFILFLSCFVCAACAAQTFNNPAAMGPPTLIYKTKKNYDKLVPIQLSDDKKTIVAYPAPTDVFYDGKLAYPTKLKNGYLLDNRGIGKNVAFLKMTYQAYAKLKELPSLEKLFALIIDSDPLLELYDAGSRYNFQDVPKEMNQLIADKKLGTLQRIQ